ncbi:GvpL/GvpF family gas vesicle protein [Streptomyces sp. NPDC006632]|uniref:GvpL/GvpF family gas vesicle protein n=1 Tax=Streptomyces sp. NPDC006632 TaxID=3157182 RepID=UPI0033A6CDD6
MTDCDAELADAGATYVFAVCRDPGLPAVDGLSGVAAHGAPVRTLSLGSLTGIVQTVRARDFTDEAWQARLADPPELERYARAHHDVVSAVAARCPTVPLPMATVYHGDDRARDALSRELARFSTALERTAHHAEWGVKVYAPPAVGRDACQAARPVRSAERTRPAPGAGLAYLERKRGAQKLRERDEEEALRTAESVDEQVRHLATASRRLRTQPATEGRTQILNATYLIAEDRSDELAVLTENLRQRTGAPIELSGPWVPYSFVGEV